MLNLYKHKVTTLKNQVFEKFLKYTVINIIKQVSCLIVILHMRILYNKIHIKFKIVFTFFLTVHTFFQMLSIKTGRRNGSERPTPATRPQSSRRSSTSTDISPGGEGTIQLSASQQEPTAVVTDQQVPTTVVTVLQERIASVTDQQKPIALVTNQQETTAITFID